MMGKREKLWRVIDVTPNLYSTGGESCREVKGIEARGRLLLRSMPGMGEDFGHAMAEILSHQVEKVVRLTPMGEVSGWAPLYAEAIESNSLPWDEIAFPVEDFEAPQYTVEFLDLVEKIAHWLKEGRNVLIHCQGGRGRTGTLAICVLMALGHTEEEAINLVKDAGSCPESLEQWRLVGKLGHRFKMSRGH